MTIDKAKLKALAEAANAVAADVNITMAVGSAPEEVKAVQDFLQQAMPKTILALLAEIERLTKFEDWFVRLDQVEQSLAASFKAERDQLKAENEALRKLKLPHFLKLSDEMRAAGDHAEQRALEDQCYSVPVLKGVFFEAAIQRWLDDQEEAIDAAMAKEAKL